MNCLVSVVWLALIAVIVYVFYVFLSKRKKCVLEFQNYGKTDIPYVTMNIQGTPLNMIVDTGCGISIISAEVLNQLEFEESPRKLSLSTIIDDSIKSEVVTIPIDINGKTIQEDFGIHPDCDIANFGVLYGITIHGILGNEFLEKTRCKIDYNKHTVTLY